MSPHIVKQWLAKSVDFETTAILFTDIFFNPGDNGVKDKFQFFPNISKNIFPLSPPQAEKIQSSIAFIHQKYDVDYKHGHAFTCSSTSYSLLFFHSLKDGILC